MTKNILVVISTSTYFNELFKVSIMLMNSGYFNPVIIFSGHYPTINRDINYCIKEKITCLDGNGKLLFASKNNYSINVQVLREKLPRRIFHLLRIIYGAGQTVKTTFDNLIPRDSFPLRLLYLIRKINFAQKVITNNNIKLVILGGDLVHYDTSCYIKAAHNKNIAAVIVPCTMSNELEMAESYLPVEKYSTNRLYNRLVGKLFSEWVYPYKGKVLIRLPAGHVLAMKLLKLSPPKPWINNSGYADCILAESEAMVDYYLQGGIPRKQIILTGALSNDVLAATIEKSHKLKRKLYDKLRFPKDKGLILIALPPDQLYMVGGRPECIFKSYSELVKYWIKTIVKIKGYKVIVNLHPSVLFEDYKYLEEYGVKILNESVTKLIPLCDFFVSSVSSVIRWAIASQKPVINYDVYRFKYKDYDNATGVILAEEKHDFEEKLNSLANDKNYYKNVSGRQKIISSYWGVLDGKAHLRMIDLFENLTKQNPELNKQYSYYYPENKRTNE